MEHDRGVILSELAKPLRNYLDSIADVLPSAIDRAFCACENPAVPYFARDYVRRNQQDLEPLFRLAPDSKALHEFQCFSLTERLKGLYVQRYALKRRLFSMRLSRTHARVD